MNKKLLLSLLAVSTMFFFACSNDNGDNNEDVTNQSSSSLTDNENSSSSGDGTDLNQGTYNNVIANTHTIKNITDNTFVIEDIYYECYQESFNNNGELVIRLEEDEIDYSIDNNNLTLNEKFFDNMSFEGTSNSLIGTWTREPNVCRRNEDEKIWCSNDNFAKVVFTNTTLDITHNYCWTYTYSGAYNGTYPKENGVTLKIIDCNTSEVSFGEHKARTVFAQAGKPFLQVTYNNTTCSVSAKETSDSEKKAACKAAYDRALKEGGDYEDMSEYYDAAIYLDFNKMSECLEDAGMPEELKRYIAG